MGTQEGERDWVDVANDLLSKCHVNLRLKKLTDCNADVFIALYENILGEKVPDYIAVPCSQEEDVHNVQCVIDSLSLDYLQISLSHITGENVVRGDKESVKNLLEIFDGLLEYLNEEINDGSPNSGRKMKLLLSLIFSSFAFTLKGPRRVLFRTQPDVLFLTLQDGTTPATPSPPDTEEEDEENLSCTRRLKDRRIHCRERTALKEDFVTHPESRTAQEDFEEPLSYNRKRNKQAEQELHEISENLSHRLEELDQMLKRVLGETGESTEVREEDKQSHHSDSIMERRRTSRQDTGVHTFLSTNFVVVLFNFDSKLLTNATTFIINFYHITLPVRIMENELLPVLRDELPHLHISPHALGRMWEQQMQQVDRLHVMSSNHSQHRSKLSRELEEAQRKHDLLAELVHKGQDHSRRLRDFKERIQQQKSTQNRLRDQRQQIARAKKYHNDYHVQHRARLMRARTKEERMFRQLFDEGLEIQKNRLREQRAYAREQRLEQQRRHEDQIKSMENYYKDQFSLLAEKLAQERQDIQVRKKAQEKALLKMKRELRSRMEREIGELQRIIIQNNEDDYFQELEIQRLRNRVRMASFQYNTSYLH
uniref:DUF5745 domain-containing protein n=1 Tax=Astatotilapia calliptera TaxID=8154 RepID=A0AAX7VY92_ASTCA